MKSNLPEGWEKVKLGEIINFRRGHDLTKKNMNVEGVYPVIGSNGIIGIHDKYILEGPVVTVGRSGNVGTPFYYEKDAWPHNTTLYIDDFKTNNPIYVYYLLKTLNLENYSGGSAVPTLNRNHIHPILVSLAPKEEQRVIADILSVLDDKIKLNNKINENLEKQAQAIFKHWFIDFEFPDENGNPSKSSGGEMIESELGIIPKGWKVGTVDDLGNVVGGSTPSRKKSEYFTTKGIPWITPKDLSNNKNIFINKGEEDITEEGFNSTSIKILPRGTVLFSSRAPIGYIGIAKNDVTTNQGFKSIIPCKVKGVSTGYIFNWLKRNIENIENRASGSTFKEISGGELKKIEAIIPDKKLLNKFEKLQNDYFNKIESNEDQNRVLNKLRDTLLPKLMNGEVRIPLD